MVAQAPPAPTLPPDRTNPLTAPPAYNGNVHSYFPKEWIDWTVQARIKWFDERNGDSVYEAGWFYFENGAARERNMLGLLSPPDSDPYKRAKTILKYREEKLRKATSDFKELKQTLTYMSDQASRFLNANAPPPPPDPVSVNKLRELRDAVQRWQEVVDEARTFLEQNKPEDQRQRDAYALENRERVARIAEEIADINI